MRVIAAANQARTLNHHHQQKSAIITTAAAKNSALARGIEENIEAAKNVEIMTAISAKRK